MIPGWSDRGFWTAVALVGVLVLRLTGGILEYWAIQAGAGTDTLTALSQINGVLTTFAIGIVGAAAVQLYRWIGAQQNGNGSKRIPPFQSGDTENKNGNVK